MFTFLYILTVALILADGYTTYRILSKGGRELNPAMRWLMRRFGLVGGMVASRIVAIGAMTLLYIANMQLLLLIVYGVYVFVVANNIKQMRK